MSSKLANFIKNVAFVSDIKNLDDNNTITHRLSNAIAAKMITIVVSKREPHDMVLPLNVIWLNFDPTSRHYNKALRRKSKTAKAPYHHTWEEINDYDKLFSEDQFYDSTDTALLTGGFTVSNASKTTKGIARLSVAPASATDPIAVGDNDPRLTNARTPLEHWEMHADEPAKFLKTATGAVTINTSSSPNPGMALIAKSATEAEWRYITAADIHS
jgi:hypothetical protein